MNAKTYFKRFFAEKTLPETLEFHADKPCPMFGTYRVVETQVVINAIKALPYPEMKRLMIKFTIADFKNADFEEIMIGLAKKLVD